MIHHLEGAADYEEEHYPLDENEEAVFKKALAAEKNRPTLDEFDSPNLEKDKIWLAEQRKKRRQEKTKRSRILEYAIIDQIERSNWLGENGMTYETTEYDDRRNHTDLVFVLEKNGKIYYLAIDVTSSENDQKLWEKEATIKKEIESGQLTHIKYFKDKNQKMELKNIPRVILALDRAGIQRLCGDLVKKKPIELAKSPEQILILEQIRDSMSDQIEYALNLLLSEISHVLRYLDKEDKEELITVLKEARHLAQKPENLPHVLGTLEDQKKLLSKLRGFPSITRYLNVISRQKAIYGIAQNLIEKKSGEISQPAAETREQNIVLRHTRSNLQQFHLPPQVDRLAEAA